MAQHRSQLLFGFDTAKHEMRMFIAGAKEFACQFQAHVTGLNSLLGRRKITPHKNIDIRSLRSDFRGGSYLRESSLHCISPGKVKG